MLKPSLTEILYTVGSGASGSVSQEVIFVQWQVKTIETPVNDPDSHGFSEGLFAKKCIFEVRSSTLTIFPKSTYKLAVELGNKSQQIEGCTSLFDKRERFNLVSKVFLKKDG